MKGALTNTNDFVLELPYETCDDFEEFVPNCDVIYEHWPVHQNNLVASTTTY